MAIRVSVETPLQDDVCALVEGLNAHLLPLSPLEFQFKMTVEQMAGPDTTVLWRAMKTARQSAAVP